MKKTGTKEWAEFNLNIQRGCERNCRYCYAKYYAVHRFKSCTLEQWKHPVIDQTKVDKNYRRRKGVIMFPSTHDITAYNFIQCVDVLQKLLKAGNKVLIVSKPDFVFISTICDLLCKYKEQIIFRFTIGSMNDDVLSFWEPNAPNFEERFKTLQYAYDMGYQTSVACEPFLDSQIDELYHCCREYITDSFWIGSLRGLKSRVDFTDVTHEQFLRYVVPLDILISEYEIKRMYRRLCGGKFIRWKDSIREIVSGDKRSQSKTLQR